MIPQLNSVPGTSDDSASEPPVCMLSPTSVSRAFRAETFSRASAVTAPPITPRSTGENEAVPTSARLRLALPLAATDCWPKGEVACSAMAAWPSRKRWPATASMEKRVSRRLTASLAGSPAERRRSVSP